ncbi:hypothetical protein CEXT_352701 [Caerostris extrusa]|uniref:MATH domain-containing protein n=1 Tax=Caerostris extrusa TaxID=172846 RepID=A0AAV4UST0_CAEEX|nr:hypothetical protein CEXT_352701 [Caerostris extrusa]
MSCKDDVALTVTWSIEGISYLKYANVCSSDFYPHSDVDQKYYLKHGMDTSDINFISFYIYNSKQDTIERDYELSILAPNGSPLISRKVTKCLFNEYKHGFSDFVERSENLENRKDEFLKNDTLTLRCRLWESRMSQKIHFFLQKTRPSIDRMHFLWTLDRFSSLTLQDERVASLRTADEGSSYSK